MLKPRPRHFLSAYLAIQMMRTKESRITSIQMMETIRAILKKSYVDAGKEPPPDEELMDGMAPEEAARDIQNRSLLDGAMIQKMATILFRHIWVIQEAFGNEQFLTSDNPFAKRPHITGTWRSMSGIASTGIEIVFPLSPKFLLTLCERNHFQNMQRFDGQRLPLLCHDNMIYNNQFQVYDSNRFVFSQNGEFSYVEQILRENPIHGNPNKMRVATNQDDALGRLGGLHKG